MARDMRLRVDDFIEQNPCSRMQINTFLLCFCVALFDGYDIGTISSMAPLIAAHFKVPLAHFGPLFSIGFIGMMIGALVMGSAADVVGRKWTIIASTFAFGLFTLLITIAPSPRVLLGLRFLVGIGLGGALPNVMALTSEYAPKHVRAFVITLVSSGITAGGLLAPLVGSYIGPVWGWNASFILGGLIPIVACLVLIVALPESLRFVIVRKRPIKQILPVLERLDPERARLSAEATSVVLTDEDANVHAHVGELFRHGRFEATILLWIVFFCTLLTALFIVSWLPSVLKERGHPISDALLLASLFSTGGLFGSAILGRLMDHFGAYIVLVPAYVLGALFVAGIGYAQTFYLLSATIFIAGFFSFGAHATVVALAAEIYPTAIRSAGIGWAWGIGRFGSIVGPLIGGAMIGAHWPLQYMFIGAAASSLIGGICCGLMWLIPRRVEKLRVGVPIHEQ